jgi:hypothetical protein
VNDQDSSVAHGLDVFYNSAISLATLFAIFRESFVVTGSSGVLASFSPRNGWSMITHMKTKSGLQPLAILVGLLLGIYAGYAAGSLLYVIRSPGSRYDVLGFPTLPPFTKLDIPSQTVNGVTAKIEGAYADPSRVLFIIHLSQELGTHWTPETFLAYANGQQIGVYGYGLNLIPGEKQNYLMVFTPEDWLNGSQLDGFLSVAFTAPTDPTQIFKFLFDFDLTIHPFLTFNPKKTLSVNGVDILLDRVVVAPATTFFYLCYPNRSDENWILTGENITLNMNRQVSNPNMPGPWIYDSAIIEGEQEQYRETGWSPPNEESRCIKLGFPIGDATPNSLTLTLPGLEDAMTTDIPEEKLSLAYQKLVAQGIDMNYSAGPGGTFIEYKRLPEGMTEKDAYRKFLEALGYVRKGPWIFKLNILYFLFP